MVRLCGGGGINTSTLMVVAVGGEAEVGGGVGTTMRYLSTLLYYTTIYYTDYTILQYYTILTILYLLYSYTILY